MRDYWKRAARWSRRSVWTFPVILFVLLLLLTAFKINGSSVGVYHQALYGADSRDPDLLYGKPRVIRSDEWLSSTQFIASQTKNDLPAYNKDFGSGRDITLQSEIPYKEWSAAFKPQNWSFFVLPFEYAFAFKWWLLIYALVISCYFFVLRALHGKKAIAILLSLSLGLSPFVLWWYQTGVFAGLAYGFWIALLGARMLGGEQLPFVKNKRLSDGLQTAGLAFLLSSFGLILYPPFQIPIAIVLIAFLVGLILQKKFGEKLETRSLLRRLMLVGLSAVIAGIVGLAFITDHKSTIHSLSSTVYPGARTISSGDLNLLSVFDGFLMPYLQSDFHGGHFFTNQSEGANFILLLPFLLLPGFALIAYEWRRLRKIDWMLLAIQLCGLLFLLRAFVHHGNFFYKLLLLQKVPNNRLIIGMGFVGILQVVYIIKKLADLKLSKRRLTMPALLYGFSCFIVTLWTAAYTKEHYPLAVGRWATLIVLALIFVSIIVALLARRTVLALSLLLVFSIGSSYQIIPLYRGLGFDARSAVADHMDAISKPTDSWATADIPLFQNMGLLAGRRSITGTQLYPDLNFWRQVGGSQYDKVYNREGHAMLTTDPAVTAPIQLVAQNAYEVKFDCSSQFIHKNINFVLSIQPLHYSCAEPAGTVVYPKLTVYFYKVVQH